MMTRKARRQAARSSRRKTRNSLALKKKEAHHEKEGDLGVDLKCLFCFIKISSSSSSAIVLEDVSSGAPLQIRLDNPEKNREAFSVLCSRLKVDWAELQNGPLAINLERSLPLCFQCQNLYQELYQLEVQIKELERMLQERALLIKRKITGSWKRNAPSSSSSGNLLLEGINKFRFKVAKSESEGGRGHTEDIEIRVPKVEVIPLSFNEENDYVGGDDGFFFGDDTGNISEAGSGAESDYSENKDGRSSGSDEASSSDSDYEVDTRWRKSARVSSASSKVSNKKTPKKNKSIHKPKSLSDSQSSYTCHICDQVLKGRNVLHLHYSEVHPEEKKYTCKYCQHRFRRLTDVSDHHRSHTGEKPFACHYCQTTFTTKKSMKSHIKHFHERELLDELFTCDQCGKSFISLRRLQMHEETHSSCLYMCLMCGLTFKQDSGFRKHNYNHHDDKARRTERLAPSQIEKRRIAHNLREEDIPTKKPIKCHACWKDLDPLESIKSHFKNEHPGLDPHQCPECGKKSKTIRDCRKHTVRHLPHMKQIQCDRCEMSFYTNAEMKNHVLKIHEKMENTADPKLVVMCKSCGSCLTSALNFCSHNKSQHGGQAECTEPIPEEDVEKLRESLNIKSPKVYTQCHVCWERINQFGGVKTHFEKEHPGLDPNQCSKCGKKWNKYGDCRKHAWRHISENKSLQCDQCPMRFFKNGELKHHIATHVPAEERQKYVCDVCSKVLTSKLGLDAHLRTHRPDKPRWVCEDCGRSYVDKKGYLEHKKIKHLELMPVKCPQCPKTFGVKAALTKHLTSHSKLRPFKCPLCERTFPYSSGRARHVREVHCKEGRNEVKKRKRKVEVVFHPRAPEGGAGGDVASENNGMEVDTKQEIQTGEPDNYMEPEAQAQSHHFSSPCYQGGWKP